ncbi:MAG: hypothetical protein AB9921_02545 [Erysipelotrichaceae bacterium]
MEKENTKAGKLVFDVNRSAYMVNDQVVHLRSRLILFIPIKEVDGKPDWMAYDVDLVSRNHVWYIPGFDKPLSDFLGY